VREKTPHVMETLTNPYPSTHAITGRKPDNGQTGGGWGTFPATRWTKVRQCAAGDDSEVARKALDSLCRDYWFPLYAFARRSGNGREDSQDLVQGFFAKAIDDKLFGKADPNAGRLRAFLLVSFKHFQNTKYKRESTIKRGAGWSRVNWDDAEQILTTTMNSDRTPDEEFDRHWALRMLNRAVRILERQYATTERGDMFQELRSFLTPDDPVEPEISRLAKKFQLTPVAARQAVCRVRERFRATLRQLIADTLDSPEEEDVDFEVETLRRALLG